MSINKGAKRVNINLSEEIWQTLKIDAIKHKTTLTRHLNDVLEKMLTEKEKKIEETFKSLPTLQELKTNEEKLSPLLSPITTEIRKIDLPKYHTPCDFGPGGVGYCFVHNHRKGE